MGYEQELRVAIRGLATAQQGLFTSGQAGDIGLSSEQLAVDLKYGLYERSFGSVLAIAGVGWWPTRRYLASTLAGGPDAMATHRAAAWLWGITQHEQKPEITVPTHRFRSLKGVRLHRVADLPDVPLERLGVPTTGVERILIDLGGVFSLAKTREALDRSIARRLVTPASVRAELDLLAQRGRPGIGPMRRLLRDAGVTGSHAPSVLEAKTRRLIDAAGLPQPECEFVAGQDGQYRLDFIWPELMLVVEVDGWQYHSSFDAFHDGMSRQNALTLEGLAFLKYSWLHVTRERKTVVRELRAAHRARAALHA